jgi:5'(3')-deoxyribonucleotidase
MRIILDLDEVVVDLLGPWLETYNQRFGDSLKTSDVTSWDIRTHVLPSAYTDVMEILREPGFFAGLPARPGAIDGVGRLVTTPGHDITIATAPSGPDSARAKIEWVTRHLGHLGFNETDVVLIHDKALLRGDVIIDDRPKYLESFQGATVCWGRPWNQHMRDGVNLWLDGDDPESWSKLCDWLER